MKPINSKERATLVWQFIFIFFLLGIIPLALIFFAYHEVPRKIDEEQQKKLEEYSNFEHANKILITQIADIDSALEKLASNPGNPEMISTEVSNKIGTLIGKTDSSKLVGTIVGSSKKHFDHVVALVVARKEINKLKEATEHLDNRLQEAKETNDNLKYNNQMNQNSH